MSSPSPPPSSSTPPASLLPCLTRSVLHTNPPCSRSPLLRLLEDFFTATTDSLFGSGIAGEGGTFLRELDASGFGNGEFEMTTHSDATTSRTSSRHSRARLSRSRVSSTAQSTTSPGARTISRTRRDTTAARRPT
ncbi:hypothetical protein B0H14DRAFT_1631712 [Mycena olivaceomarginata]|nr:hypothetical protein B0H14DRAFT_1631712 [Mycena olivaceomarginata]